MFKVSFKDDFMNVLTFQDKITVVTLKGTCLMPDWWEHIPQEINNWIWTHPSVDVHDCWSGGNLKLFIEATAKAKCANGDSFDSELGKRIAEARAKIRIYKFMHTLCGKLCAYYYSLVYGKQGEATSNFVAPNDHTSIYLDEKKYKKLLDHERHHLVELLQKTV